MSISSETRKAGPFDGNDVTVDFPFAFKVFAEADLLVVLADADGVETELTLTTDYTVALNGDQEVSPGGTVTVLAPPATGNTLTISSAMEVLQPLSLTNAGGFYPRVLNDALDRLTIIAQQLGERISRSLKLAISTPAGVSAELPAPVPYQVFGWNSDGTRIVNVDPAYATSLSADLASTANGKGASMVGIEDAAGRFTGDTVEEVLLEVPTNAELAGQLAAEGFGYSAVATHVAGTIGGYLGDEVHASAHPWFVGPTQTAAYNTSALQACITFANGRKIILPPGDIPLNAGEIESTVNRLHMSGQGRRATRFIIDVASTGLVFHVLSSSLTIEEFSLIMPAGDGVIGFGSETTSLAIPCIREVEFVQGEVAINYTGTGGWPLGSVISGIYLYQQSLGGIIIDNTFSAGQGVHDWSNVVHIGGTQLDVQLAKSLVVVVDATATTDTLTWAATDEKRYGWHVMRKPLGSTDTQSWLHVGYTNAGTRAFTATKTAGVYYDYVVTRRTVGAYLLAQEGVNVTGSFGYASDGLRLVSCRAVTAAIYGEWRGQSLTKPVPRGHTINAQSVGGLNITHLWSDGLRAGAYIRDCSGSIATGRVDAATAAAIELYNSSRSTFEIGPITLGGGTPKTVEMDPTSSFGTWGGFVSDAAMTKHRLDDGSESRYEAAFRGVVNAKMRSDGTGGHFEATGGHTTWTPAASAGLTTTGGFTLTGTATWVGSYWHWTLRITATSGNFSATANTTVTGLASLTPVPIAAGVNSIESFEVVNVSTPAGLGAGYVVAGVLHLPAFSTMTDVLISGRCKV